jgi:integrase
MSRTVARNVFDEVATSAGLKHGGRGLHSLRHSRLTELALKTKDPEFVRLAGRHDTLSMSDIYVKHLDLRERLSEIGSIL